MSRRVNEKKSLQIPLEKSQLVLLYNEGVIMNSGTRPKRKFLKYTPI
jgi:hypothetical protein